jgi:two-component system, cell cycle response regulator
MSSIGEIHRTGGDSSAATSAENSSNVIVVVGMSALQPRLAWRLRAEGFSLMRTRSAEEAQQFVKDRVPVAILLGTAPGADPYAVVRSFRRQERLAFAQIVLLPVEGQSLKLSQALRAGADDVVDLSFDGLDDEVDCIVARIARFQALAELAALDPLTGLHSRRLMNDQVVAEIARAGRTGTKLSVAIVDLDNFKRINDVHGHAAGDRTLIAFTQALRRSLRSYDMTYRFGGDEFFVLFPGCDAKSARAALTQLRIQVGTIASDLPTVTFSAGIAEFPRDGVSWKGLFEVADRNLRLAKEDGRHRTVPGDSVAPPA